MVASNDDRRVVIAIDPHKASWTAAAVDESLQPLATIRVPVAEPGIGRCAASRIAGRVACGRLREPRVWVRR